MTDQKVDNEDLLSTIIEDSKSSSPIYLPTAYWQGYCDRLVKRIKQVGLSSFRSDYKLTKGYIMSDVTELTDQPIKKGTKADFLRSIMMKVPFVSQLLKLYEGHTTALSRTVHRHYRSYYHSIIHFSKKDYSNIEDCMFADPAKLSLSKNITPSLVYSINTLSLIEEYKDLKNVNSIVEIGGGFGSLCEVIMKSSQVEKYYLFDISPMVYISTQYLKQAFPNEVADYIDYKIGITKRITVLPTWCFDEVEDEFDLFINTASFQEMEKDVVENYLNILNAKSMFLLSLKDGHLNGANNQKDQIDFNYLSTQVLSRGFVKSNKEVSPNIALVTNFSDFEAYNYSFYESNQKFN